MFGVQRCRWYVCVLYDRKFEYEKNSDTSAAFGANSASAGAIAGQINTFQIS